jgi:hypothetical protein
LKKNNQSIRLSIPDLEIIDQIRSQIKTSSGKRYSSSRIVQKILIALDLLPEKEKKIVLKEVQKSLKKEVA